MRRAFADTFTGFWHEGNPGLIIIHGGAVQFEYLAPDRKSDYIYFKDVSAISESRRTLWDRLWGNAKLTIHHGYEAFKITVDVEDKGKLIHDVMSRTGKVAQ